MTNHELSQADSLFSVFAVENYALGYSRNLSVYLKTAEQLSLPNAAYIARHLLRALDSSTPRETVRQYEQLASQRMVEMGVSPMVAIGQ